VKSRERGARSTEYTVRSNERKRGVKSKEWKMRLQAEGRGEEEEGVRREAYGVMWSCPG
jgi:hypothetical protein